MPGSSTINDLLSLWEREHTDPEQLCRDCPELLPQLREKIIALAAMESFLGLTPATSVSGQESQNSASDETDPPGRMARNLALRWQSLQLKGQHISLDELCRDHPDLVSEVQQLLDDASRWTHGFTPPLKPEAQAKASPCPSLAPQASKTAEPTRDESVQTFGRYLLERRLGRGGFGEVWQAYDPVLDYKVAIKRPRPDRRFSEEERNQFVAEARKLVTLKHPHIVPVMYAERDGETVYIVSEFIDGTNLSDYIEGRRLPFDEAVEIVIAIAEALHHAHLNDVVHRDVKSANILLDRNGKPYLADFGLAVSEEEMLREPPAILGTYAYMSPEQARGDSHLADARTDIYSLGVVLYQLFTGRHPFKAADASSLREQILHRRPRPPRTIDDTIPQELERICLKCLAKSMEDRYTTAADLARELRQWQQQKNLTADTTTKTAAPAKPRRRWWVPVLIGSVFVFALVSVLLFSVRPWADSTSVSSNPSQDAVVSSTPLKPGVWYNLLDNRPKTLLQPGDLLLDFNRPKKRLWWDTKGSCLFSLKSPTTPNYEVEVTLEQLELHGHRGLFFSPQPLTTGGKKNWYVAQVLLIRHDALHEGKFVLSRSLLKYTESGYGAVDLIGIGPSVPLRRLSKLKVTLGARIQGSRLLWVAIDSVEVKGLNLDTALEHPNPLVGDFGVYADMGSGELTNARWKFYEGNP